MAIIVFHHGWDQLDLHHHLQPVCLQQGFSSFHFYRPAQFFQYYIFSSPQGTGVQQQDLQDNPFLLHQLRLSKVPCQSRHPIIIYIVIISIVIIYIVIIAIISIKYFVISPPCLKLEALFFFPNQQKSHLSLFAPIHIHVFNCDPLKVLLLQK